MLLLVLRIASAPVLIALGSAAQRRFGQSIGGRLVGLPLTSLPLLALLTMSEGRVFAGSAARALLGAGVAQAAWCLVYAVAARRRSPLTAAVAATGAFGLACVALYAAHLPPIAAAVASAVAILATLAVWPAAPSNPGPNRQREADAVGASRGDLVARMLAGAVFTLGLTGAAAGVGAETAGLIGAFPVLTVVLAVATQWRDGGEGVGRFLEGVVAGSLSVVAGLTTVAFFLVSAGPLVAFPLAVLASGAAQFLPVDWARRRRPTSRRLDPGDVAYSGAPTGPVACGGA